MKDKKRMVWIISVVCIILAVAFCAVSIVKMNRLQKQARDLETEVARLMSEQNEKQTETLTETEEIKEVKKQRRKSLRKRKKKQIQKPKQRQPKRGQIRKVMCRRKKVQKHRMDMWLPLIRDIREAG